MNDTLAAPVLSVATLRVAGRTPALPFALALGDGEILSFETLLRILPGKRVVGGGVWRGRRVLAKLFVAEGSARHWQHECDGLAALAAAGVPTPEVLLAAALPDGGHLLLTAWLDGATTLAEAWEACGGGAPENTAAHAVLAEGCAALGRLHAAGLVHDDAHLGNFLRQDGTLYVIDGDAVRVLAAGDAAGRESNLALMLAQLPPAWDAHWAPLLAAYQGASGSAPQPEALAARVEGCRKRRWDDFLGKIGRDCTLFSVQRSWRRFSVVARQHASALHGVLARLDTAVEAGRRLKDGRTCTVARIDDPQAGVLVVKRYNLKNIWHAFGRSWRPSRAWHSWREGHRLRFYGIATPEPLALVEERFGPLRRRAFLVNAFCPGRDLLEILSADAEPPVEIAAALLTLFGTLHALRISHGDLKATNLLWHDGQVVLIDLDAMTQHRSSRTHAQAWQRDRARFLRNWPAGSPLVRWLDARLPLP